MWVSVYKALNSIHFTEGRKMGKICLFIAYLEKRNHISNKFGTTAAKMMQHQHSRRRQGLFPSHKLEVEESKRMENMLWDCEPKVTSDNSSDGRDEKFLLSQLLQQTESARSSPMRHIVRTAMSLPPRRFVLLLLIMERRRREDDDFQLRHTS